MEAVIAQEVLGLRDLLLIDEEVERHQVDAACEALEMIELRYQALWARAEMEAVFAAELDNA